MDATDLRDKIREAPFNPFRVHLTKGITFDLNHPEFIAVTKQIAYLANREPGDTLAERHIRIGIQHIIHLESLSADESIDLPEPTAR